MVKYPVLYDRQMQQKGIVYAESLSASLTARPMSVASMTVPESVDVQMQDFVQIFFPDGGSQFFRVKSIADSTGGLVTVQMEHGIVWAEDYILPEKEDGLTDTPRNVLERFFARLTDTKWRLGVVEATEEIEIDYDYPNVMQGLIDVLELCKGYTYQFDQSGDVWYVNLVLMPNEVGCEGRITRNLLTAPVINYNDQEQCTRVYVPGKSWHIDADNIDSVGVIERTLNIETKGVSDNELKEKCREYLAEHKNPAVSITVDAQELADLTGEPFDSFVEGTICRLCLTDYGGAIIQERISTRIYPDLLGAPQYVQVQIASELPDTSSQINGIIVTQKKIVHKVDTELYDMYAGIEDVDGRLTSVYNEVGLRLDAQEAEIELKATSAQVNEVVQRVNTAEIEINAAKAEIKLKANTDDVADELSSLSTEMTVAADEIRGTIQEGDKVVGELALTVDGLENWQTDAAGNISELTNTVRGVQSQVTTVDGRVTTLSNTADGLTSTIVEQGVTLSEFKTRSDEISAAVLDTAGNIGSLTVTANAVTAKVTGADEKVSALVVTADGLTNTVSQQGTVLSSLTTRIDEISAMVTDGNNKTAQLIVKSDSITQKVEDVGTSVSQFRIDLDGIHGEVVDVENNANARMDILAGRIELKADQTLVDDVSERVSQAEIDIDGVNAQIALKASRTTVDALDERVSSAEIEIDGANAAIALKAEKSVVNSQGERLSTAEANIDAANAQIELKVNKDGVIGAINVTPEEARIKAAKIVLDGYVTTSKLSAEVASLRESFSFEVTTGTLNAGRVNTTSLTWGGYTVFAYLDKQFVTGVTMPTFTGKYITYMDDTMDIVQQYVLTGVTQGEVTTDNISVLSIL